VEALNGAPVTLPGMQVNSSEDNMDKLLQALSDKSNRNAHFKTVIT
jgi:XTP/dITP diphosphohydrolase